MGEPTPKEFKQPILRIKNEDDMTKWKESKAYQEIFSFIEYINNLVKDTLISSVPQEDLSKEVQGVLKMLDELSNLVDKVDLVKGSSSRFGNMAFRTWHKQFENIREKLLEDLLPPQLLPAKVELLPYLAYSFGDASRIDYGTGHELNFLIFLYCLASIQFFQQTDCKPFAFVVFPKYLELVRKIQIKFKLEPAGSHGVWGLDDFQFVPYIWGSSQMIDSQDLPSSITNSDMVERLSKDSLFFGCIKFIHQVKRGPFHEHSPMLYDISTVYSWAKVNSGLVKMFKVEVLGKFPVVQHIYFGNLFSFEPAPNP